MKILENIFEFIIFQSRWIQLPIYLGLIIGSVLYAYKFLIELIHIITEVTVLSEADFMLGILTLVDVTMVVNLLIIVIIAGYSTFVSKLKIGQHEDKPEWLDKIDAGAMKVKLATSLVGVSGIHLLKTFINIQNLPTDKVLLQIAIHLTFLVSAFLLAYTEKIAHSSHKANH